MIVPGSEIYLKHTSGTPSVVAYYHGVIASYYYDPLLPAPKMIIYDLEVSDFKWFNLTELLVIDEATYLDNA